MNLEYTEDGYLRLLIDGKETVDDEIIQTMNSNAYLLPAFKDRYENNSIMYHIGSFIILSDYLEKKVISLQESRRIILNIIEGFIKVKTTGLEEENVISYLNYIYIEPKTREVRFVYYPVFSKMEFGGIAEILRNFCLNTCIENGEFLVGTILKYMNCQVVLNLVEFKKAIEIIDDIEGKAIEKIVEKPIERVVERVIEKTVDNAQSRIMIYTILLLNGIFILGMPYILVMFFDETMVTVPGVINFFLFILATLIALLIMQNIASSNENEKMVVTVQKPNDMVDTSLDYQKEMHASAVLFEESKRLKENRKKNDFKSERLYRESKDIYSATLRRENEILEGTTILKEKKVQAYLLQEGKTSVMDRIYLKEEEMLLGRDKAVDFRMNDSAVSKKHAKIIHRNCKFYLMDLDSSNGTYLNNFKLESYQEYELKSGNRVTFGDLHYFFYE